MKRIVIICLVLVFLLTGCNEKNPEALKPTITPEQTSQPTPTLPQPEGLSGELDEKDLQEVGLANELGLIPSTWNGNYHDPISYQNMVSLAKQAVELFYGTTILPDMTSLSANLDKASVTRLEAAIILTEATRAAWGEYPWPNGEPKKPIELKDRISADDHLLWNHKINHPATIRLWSNVEWPLSVVSSIYAVQQVDKITGKALLPLDKDYNFNPENKVSYLEAIQSAVRLYRSFDPKPHYVSLEEVTPHKISKELYNKESALPDASNELLPAWRGILYFPKCWPLAEAFGSFNDTSYHESDFKQMREAGLNMVAIYINPTRLGWPYHEEDVSKVNLVEMELLDQAIGWAFENGLHVQLGINLVPGVGRYNMAEAFDQSLLFQDEAKAKLLTRYWRMLAKRYADIPNKYLGFNLYNEIDPPSDEEYLRVFEPSIDAIWEESPDRLIIADIHSNRISGKSMAQKGVALSRHQYAMPLFDYNLSAEDGGGLMELYPDYEQELTWPQLYLPSMLHGQENKITFTGSFTEGELILGVNQIADGDEVLCIRINDEEVLAEKVTSTGEKNAWNMQKVNREYTVAIPEGVDKIEIYNKEQGTIVYNRLKFVQKGKEDIILFPHDTFNMNWSPETVSIQIQENGSLEGNRFLTWKDLKSLGDSISYDSIKEMAERNKVGFFVGEFGPFGEDGLPKDVLSGYLTMMIEGMNQDNTGWALGSYVGRGQLVETVPDIYPEWTYEEIDNSPYYVNVFLRDLLRKYAEQN